MEEELKILSAETFCREIADLMANGLSSIDAVVHYCEVNNIEVEMAANLIKSNPKIKSMIQQEGEDLRCLPRSSRLPI